MAKLRTLWKVTQGFADGPAVDPNWAERPESKAKVYDIYVRNNVEYARLQRNAGQRAHDFTDVWCDDRDGQGFRLYERIKHHTGEG